MLCRVLWLANTEQGTASRAKVFLGITYRKSFLRDPEKASAFIIPFDAGVHSYIDHITGKPRLASPHGWKAIELLKNAASNEVSIELVTVTSTAYPAF